MKLGRFFAEESKAASVRRQLAPFGVRYSGIGHYSGVLDYDRALLLRAWKEYPETPWGQRAFLMLQNLSCVMPTAFQGPGTFRGVIQQGESFLRAYPETALRKEQMYHLAQAYETMWSLSQAKPGDTTAEGSRVDKASGERGRLKAIELYDELFRISPESPEARAGQFVLPRLRLKLDTGERKFFCFSC